MISIDLETSGLWFQHGTNAFAVGVYSETGYKSYTRSIDPLTRLPEHGEKVVGTAGGFVQHVRNVHEHQDVVVYQNANFDLKALCKMGILDWHQPSEASFWSNIYDLGSISHLHDSRDVGKQSSLKSLTPKYLDRDYESEKELDRLVGRCRTFITRRCPTWKIASEITVPQATKEWVKQDMWLPAAILKNYHDQAEVKLYFNNKAHPNDYTFMSTAVNTYLHADCMNTYDLAKGMLAILFDRHGHKETEELLKMNHDIHHVIWDIETLGVNVKKSNLISAIDACEHWTAWTLSKCQELTGRDVDEFTPAILREILFTEYALEPISYTPKAKEPQVNADSLLELKQQCVDNGNKDGDNFLSHLLVHRKYSKKAAALKGYDRASQRASLVPYPLHEYRRCAGDGHGDSWLIFPGLKSTGTGTTRFSSSNPAGQTMEKAGNVWDDEFPDIKEMMDQSPTIRSVFGPDLGRWWIPMDYSQLQLRVFAAATGEEEMIQAFRDGYDFHEFIARVIFDLDSSVTPTSAQRRIGKNCNFGFIFGASEKRIDATCNQPGLYKYLMESFPNAHAFIEETKEKIRETGIVHTLGGYPLHIPQREWHGRMSYAAHMGVNYIVQGTEGEIVKKAMLACHDYLKTGHPECRLTLQVHDEIVFDVPERVPKYILCNLRDCMQDAGAHYGVETPVDAEVCLDSFAVKTTIIL